MKNIKQKKIRREKEEGNELIRLFYFRHRRKIKKDLSSIVAKAKEHC